jgi:isopentenyl diphosphate isomerase/L-lactate dehydrogenase-like FMN-dependent dehydrogenase
MADETLGAYNIFDLRERALKRVPKGLFEFVDRGTEDEVSLRNNRAVFERIRFRPRTLIDVSKRSQEITLFGQKQKMPIVIAPTGTAGLMWYEGEIALARAAKAAGVPFTLATGSQTAMERVAAEAGGRLWFQLYMWSRVDLSHQLVDRAKAAGFEALLLTVDSAVAGNREYNLRNGFTVPFTFTRTNVTDVLLHPRWLASVLARYVLTTGMPRYENYPEELRTTITARPMGRSMLKCEEMNYEHLRTLRKRWPGLLMVKGIAHPQDAIKAAECGVDGVVVSNHGGRNLDGSMAPLEALPQIVDAVGKRVTVLVDSGFRRGSDIVKALALGAQAVLIGRATLYGTAAAGEAGAARAIAILREEIDRVLALIGCPNVADVGPEYLHTVDPWFGPIIEARLRQNPEYPRAVAQA